jgi:hypothetical protein
MSFTDKYNKFTAWVKSPNPFLSGYEAFFNTFTYKEVLVNGCFGPVYKINFYWNDYMLFRESIDAVKYVEYIEDQLKWIKSRITKNSFKSDPESLKKECKRRIDFFLFQISSALGCSYQSESVTKNMFEEMQLFTKFVFEF